LLDRIVGCLRDYGVTGSLQKIEVIEDQDAYTKGCYGDGVVPRGYYSNYKEMIFVAGGAPQVNGIGCAGALLFANQRSAGQARITAADRLDFSKYLEGNLASSGPFSGQDQLERVSSTQTMSQDIVRCIPNSASFATVNSPDLINHGFAPLASYDPGTRTLTLGAENVTTPTAPAADLFGCAWTPEANTQGKGFRAYFTFRFKQVGANVGNNGFIFTAVDGISNGTMGCGAAGSHLGYSGYNGVTPLIAAAKVGVEFDQSRDAGFNENALNPGRNDPCGASSCGGSVGYNSHSAITYWGHEKAGADDVTLPNNDDNAHGLPSSAGQATYPRPPPRNPDYPSPGIAFVDLRGHAGQDVDGNGGSDGYLYHVRVEFIKTQAASLSSSVGDVLAASTVDVDTSSPGPTVDGVSLFSGSRVLLAGQSSSADNGVYVWQDATTTMTRATDADSGTELTNAWVNVAAGANAGTWRQQLPIINIGTDPQSWQQQFQFTHFQTQVWIERDSNTTAQLRTAMQDTTRSMSQLYPGYAPKLSDIATMYDVVGAACGSGCPSDQICGHGNLCYRQAFKSVRLGFTNSQRTQDQQVTVKDFFASWLP
jgi:hypothetical protein